MNITLQQLKAKGACEEQVALFAEHFGQGSEVTLEKCLSVAGIFDWYWAAKRFLLPTRRAEYFRVEATAWVEYFRAVATARAEYEHAVASARAERAKAPAWV